MRIAHRYGVCLIVSGAIALSCSDDDGGDGDAGNSGGTSVGGAGGASGGVGAGRGGNAGVGGGAAGNGTAGNGTAGDAPAGAGNGGMSDAGAGGIPGGSDLPGGGGVGGEPVSRATCTFPVSAALAKASVPDGFCAWQWATGVANARGITIDGSGNVLAVARGGSAVVALWDANEDGVSDETERATLVTQSGLNHGIALHGGYLYASSASTVFRWAYAADRQPLTEVQSVITRIPTGGHSTRTLAFDDEFLYVSVGSGSNLDPNSNRARIRRFPIASLGSAVDFDTGEVFADGLRNEVGLRFDPRGRLWGVENGRDELVREDLGGDIHEDNPAEELNLFSEPGKFYGYPYCWTEFLLPNGVGMGPGTQWADPTNDAQTDAWCRDPDNVVPPVLAMQAHSAPLDLLFYPGGSFPASYTGDLFVTMHGSWNRDEPTGYKVVHVPFGADGMPSGAPTPFLEYAGTGDKGGEWPHRPVGLTVLPNGVLLVTSDASSSILAVGYAP